MTEIVKKRCKECGDVARIHSCYGGGDEKYYYIGCDGCSNGTVRHYKDKNDVIKAWELEYTLAEYNSTNGRHWGNVPYLGNRVVRDIEGYKKQAKKIRDLVQRYVVLQSNGEIQKAEKCWAKLENMPKIKVNYIEVA